MDLQNYPQNKANMAGQNTRNPKPESEKPEPEPEKSEPEKPEPQFGF